MGPICFLACTDILQMICAMCPWTGEELVGGLCDTGHIYTASIILYSL